MKLSEIQNLKQKSSEFVEMVEKLDDWIQKTNETSDWQYIRRKLSDVNWAIGDMFLIADGLDIKRAAKMEGDADA